MLFVFSSACTYIRGMIRNKWAWLNMFNTVPARVGVQTNMLEKALLCLAASESDWLPLAILPAEVAQPPYLTTPSGLSYDGGEQFHHHTRRWRCKMSGEIDEMLRYKIHQNDENTANSVVALTAAV